MVTQEQFDADVRLAKKLRREKHYSDGGAIIRALLQNGRSFSEQWERKKYFKKLLKALRGTGSAKQPLRTKSFVHRDAYAADMRHPPD